MKFPTFYRHGVRNHQLLRFFCVMFSSIVGREDPIIYAIVMKKYIETGEQPHSLEKEDYVDKVL